MKRTLAVALLVFPSGGMPAAEARGFKKAYFGATEVGTFARHKATDETGAVNEYTYKGNFKNVPATTTGDLWLSDAVPFGLVKEVMVTRDAAGNELTRIETVLSEKGTGSQTALPRWSWEPAAKKPAAQSRQPR